MDQQPNWGQLIPKELGQKLERVKTSVLILVGLFVFSGPILALLNNFEFNMYFILFIVAVVVLLFSIKQINQYERGIKFTIGKFTGLMDPLGKI